MILESPPKNTPAGVEGTVLLPTVKRSARVPYTTEQMFDLVNDVESYPKFLHWCRGARIESKQGNTVEATLEIGVLGFHQRFRTRNTLQRPERIGIDLVSGPFRRLRGEWRFAAAQDRETDISLTLSPFGVVFAKVFEELAVAQMGAFVERAKKIYGTDT
jgi:ribosome-associated toxin RatA of RatAB toxin-antitoxin module